MSVYAPCNYEARVLLTSRGGINAVGVDGGVGSGTLRSNEAGEQRNSDG